MDDSSKSVAPSFRCVKVIEQVCLWASNWQSAYDSAGFVVSRGGTNVYLYDVTAELDQHSSCRFAFERGPSAPAANGAVAALVMGIASVSAATAVRADTDFIRLLGDNSGQRRQEHGVYSPIAFMVHSSMLQLAFCFALMVHSTEYEYSVHVSVIAIGIRLHTCRSVPMASIPSAGF